MRAASLEHLGLFLLQTQLLSINNKSSHFVYHNNGTEVRSLSSIRPLGNYKSFKLHELSQNLITLSFYMLIRYYLLS